MDSTLRPRVKVDRALDMWPYVMNVRLSNRVAGIE